MLTFAVAVFFLIATPGPGVMSAAGVGASYGARAGLIYVTGLCLGNLLIIALVVSGLAAVVLAVPGLRPVLAVVSVLYIVYLAAKIAFAGAKIGFLHTDRPPGLWYGFALQPINPKAYAVNTALFTGFPIEGLSLGWEVAVKVLVANAIWWPLHLVWVWAGISLRRLDLAPALQRRINFGMAASMLAVVALAILAQR